MARIAVRSLLLLPALLALACGGSRESLWRATEASFRDVMAVTYPSGTPRRTVREVAASPDVYWISRCEDDDARGWFQELSTRHVESAYARVDESCDVIFRARTEGEYALVPVGLYGDYVYYDASGHVLVAFRRYLD